MSSVTSHRPHPAKITAGAALSVFFDKRKVLSLARGQLVAIGERTGNMDEMLKTITKYHEKEFTRFFDSLKTIIEPLMISLSRSMIGIIEVALYMPVF